MNRQYFVQSSLGKIAKMLADRYQLIVKFEGLVPRTNGREIVLPAVSEELPESEQRELLSYVLHEAAHVLFTEMEVAAEFSQKFGQMGFQMLNAVEDARIEHLMMNEYIGARRYFDESIAKWQESVTTTDPWVQLCCSLYLTGRGYKVPDGWYDGIYDDHVSRAMNAKTTRETAAIVEEILSSCPINVQKEEQDAGSDAGADAPQTTATSPREMMVQEMTTSCQNITQDRCRTYRKFAETDDFEIKLAPASKDQTDRIEAITRVYSVRPKRPY